MAGIHALILAAGRGSRLGDSGDEVPKCLLEIGRRRLIEHQIDMLTDAGVGPVHVVVGYGADEIREIVGMRAGYVVNPRWEQTNSLYSFWLARNSIRGEVVVLNSDVIFAPEILGRLLDQPGDAVAIDSSSGAGREQMKVKASAGLLVAMSKELPPDQAAGENVGILKLTAETAALTFDCAGRLIEDGGGNRWVGAAITEVAPQLRIHAVDVSGLPWVEIDFASELSRARKEVWPSIQGGAYRRRRMLRAGAWLLGAALLIAAIFIGQMIPGPGQQPPTEWESVPIENLPPARISLGEGSQDFWILGDGALAEAAVFGGGPVRVESRLADPRGERDPYVLEVLLDGERVDWFMLTTRPSGKATHPDWIVGRKKRITLDVPEGGHRLQVRLVAPRGALCLVRIRQHVADTEE